MHEREKQTEKVCVCEIEIKSVCLIESEKGMSTN